MFFVCCKPTPLWLFVYRTSPVYQDPTCTDNFLYRYTSRYQQLLGTRGGGNVLSNYLVLVDNIVKKWHFCSKISKLRQYIEVILSKEKKKEIWPSPMTKTPIPTENSKTKGQHTQTPPKTSITQQLRTDLGRSVGVTSNPTGVVKPVYGIPTFPLTAKAV